MATVLFCPARAPRRSRASIQVCALLSLAVCIGAVHASAHDLVFTSGFEKVTDAPASEAEAARFLTMTTFGPTPASIAQLRGVGYGQWIEQQLSMPTTPERPTVQALDANVKNPGQNDRMQAWFANAVTAPDQLRQRAAWALSQIMVTTDQLASGVQDPIALAEYYDLLARDSVGYYDASNQYHPGTYYNLLQDVTHSPAMGRMLSDLRNEKSNPVKGTSPDENYAREVMQLFSIGLVERNLDFSEQLDNNQQPIPTYTPAMITGNAAVFTGLSYESGWNSNPTGLDWAPADYLPMVCYEQYHDETAKTVLDGYVVPGGANSCEPDTDDLLHIISNHHNVAPFISRQLIERFTSSNPSAAYIARVATVFVSSGQDLGAVLKAVLTDPEAAYNAPSPPAPYVFGKAREPLLKLTALWRYYAAAAQNGLYAFNSPQNSYVERPLGAPSVFNFYLPDYLPPGEMAQANLYGPEFQILNESSVVATANDLGSRATAYLGNPVNTSGTIAVNLTSLVALASNPPALVAQLDHDLLYGSMSSQMNTILVTMIGALPASDPTARVTGALQVLLASPEFSVQK